MDYMLLTGGVNLAQKFFDGSLKLGVYAFHYSSGVVGNLYVRFELRVFQIVAFGSTISYYRNAEYERRVLKCLPVYGSHGAGHRHAYEFAHAFVLVYPRCAVGVAVVGLTLEHDAGFVPSARGHVAHISASDYLCQVFIAAEEHFYILVETASAVPSGIDYNPLLVHIFSEQVGVDTTEAGVVHRA